MTDQKESPLADCRVRISKDGSIEWKIPALIPGRLSVILMFQPAHTEDQLLRTEATFQVFPDKIEVKANNNIAFE